MPIRTAWGGRAWAREEPTQLELVQSHLENKLSIPEPDLREMTWGDREISGMC